MVLLTVITVPAFDDNYLWLIHDAQGQACAVDPGDADAILDALSTHHLKLTTILITHHHHDHIGGVAQLVQQTGACVYGPDHPALPAPLHKVENSSTINVLGEPCEVISTPGHTLTHVVYYFPTQSMLFCGDTLFVAGCGRLFEGTSLQMNQSLTTLSRLPPNTAVYCAHEYTLGNLQFAQAVEPTNQAIADKIKRCQQLRNQGIPTVPSTIAEELLTNPFMRSHLKPVIDAARAHTGQSTLSQPDEVLGAIRSWKDGFR